MGFSRLLSLVGVISLFIFMEWLGRIQTITFTPQCMNTTLVTKLLF